VDHRRRLRVLNVANRRLRPVRAEILVRQLVAQVELPVPLHIALRVHRDPVRRAGAGADRLEAIAVRKNPVRPVPAGAPSERTHPRGVDDALRDQVIDPGHDVVVAEREVVADDVRLVRFAVVRRPAIVRTQHGVPLARVHLCAVPAVEAQNVGRR